MRMVMLMPMVVKVMARVVKGTPRVVKVMARVVKGTPQSCHYGFQYVSPCATNYLRRFV